MTTVVQKARTAHGDLPEGWTRRRLRFDARLNPKKSSLDMEPDELVSFIPMGAVGEYGGLDLDDVRELEDIYDGYTYFAEGDLCIAKITPCFENGKGALAEGLTNGVGFGTTELHVVRPGPNIDRRFLFYVSIADDFRKLGESEMYGAAGQKRINESFIKDWVAPLPPPERQRRIARFLDEKTARIDGLIGKKRTLLDRLAEKRQALITRAVTKGLNPDAPMKPSGIDWLGDIPVHWNVLPLNRIVRMRSGDFIAASDIETDGRYLVFGGNGVRGFAEDFNTIGPIILVGRQGALCGNVQVAHSKVWVSEHALRCLPEKHFEVRWLAYMLETMNLNQHSVSAAQPGLSIDNLKHLRTAFPPPHDQRNIADQLHAHCRQSEEIVRESRKSLSLLEEYRSALITTAVTGQFSELR